MTIQIPMSERVRALDKGTAFPPGKLASGKLPGVVGWGCGKKPMIEVRRV
jgi:hypothetical protein